MTRVLHLASSNRWTGAAAPAYAEVEALREAGLEASYAYVGGYRLEEKLSGSPFAFPLIEKKQDPMSMRRSIHALREFIRENGIDIVHAHLTYDHWLARFAAGDATIFRTFHSMRTLRRDPFTQLLMRSTRGVCVVNPTFRSAPLLRGRSVLYTPPPLKMEQFHPGGPNARATYGLRSGDFVIGVIGKLAPNRGFEAALETFSFVHAFMPGAKMLIIGHGEHRTKLEQYARVVGVADDVIWAGYHETDLAEHLRAFDVMLFTAAGSDEGHRAVQEALGCGVPVASYPIPGITELLGDLSSLLIAPAPSASALARVVQSVRVIPRDDLRLRAAARAAQFAYEYAAVRLRRAYEAASAPAL